MKVLFLSDAASPHTRKWLSGLKRRGLDVALFSLTPNYDDFYEELDIPLKALSYNAQTGRIAHKLLYFKSLPVIRKMSATLSPDIVHAHYASSYGLLGSLAVKGTYCISVWGSDIYAYPRAGVLYRKLLEHTLGRANLLFSTSDDMASETALYTKNQIEVIPFGINLAAFPMRKDALEKDEPIRFASAKSLKHIYNVPIVVTAFRKLQALRSKVKMELHIAGDGPEKEKCERLAGEELERTIFFSGRIIPEKMPGFYRDKHVLVNIPETESFGVSILEASASGLAVIATRAGGIPEVVSHGETGLLLDHINEVEVSEAMDYFVADTERIRQFGLNGRAYVEENYDFETCLDKQIEQYKKLNGN
jgi:glycosyltransferase involved in cell wall biosynthesis